MRLLLSILFISHIYGAMSQNRCGVDHRYFAQHANQSQRFEQWLKLSKPNEAEKLSQFTQQQALYQIPVVVHIVHKGEEVGTGLNLSDERIWEQIDILNQDFRRLNSDTLLTPAGFQSVAADTQIEFVLAKRDPEGLPTTGIVRTKGSLNGYRYSDIPSQSDEKILKQESFWPTDEYLNIYVTDLLNGYIGYAQFPFVILDGIDDPNENESLDGVVIDYKYFGINPDTGGSFESYGRTLTHEMGHFFGLRHVWGDNSTCSEDDFCDDTPEQSSSYSTQCPADEETSCNSSDMYSNYLNYTNDACMNIFTRCQKNRMHTVIENSPRVRKLLNSPALNDPIITQNDLGIRAIISPINSLCDDLLYPVIEIRNYGTNVIGSANILFELESEGQQLLGLPTPLNPLQTQIINFEPVQVTTQGTLQIDFQILNVNDQEDANAENNRISVPIYNTGEAVIPFSNSFNAVQDLVTTDDASEELSQWEIMTVPYETANNQAASIHFNTNEQLGSTSTFITPIFDLSALNAAQLSFSYSYQYSASTFTKDRLRVLVSTDCGQTFVNNTPLFSAAGNNLRTSFSFPQGPDDWAYVEINASQYTGYEGVQFAFEGLHGAGGHLFVDSIQLVSSSLKAYDIGIKAIENLPVVSCYTSAIPSLHIKNYGFETINKVSVDYQFQGINEQVVEEGLNLKPGEETILQYPFSRLTDGAYNIQFAVSLPNDSVDEVLDNNFASYQFYVDNEEVIVPTKEDFEGESSWIINTPTDSSLFQVVSISNDNHALLANAYENSQLGTAHWFVSPLLDMRELDSASMTFRYAYQGQNNRTDRLQVLVSDNCGGNFNDILFDQSTDQLTSTYSNEAFISNAEDDWETVFIDLSPYTNSDLSRIAFVFQNGNGNNLYIDDINFFQSSNPDILRFEEEVVIYPNPATTEIRFSINLQAQSNLMLRLVDMSGKIIRSKNIDNALNQEIVMDTRGLKGFHVLHWQGQVSNGSKMIFIKGD